jgi:hypothetical protein
MVFETTGKFQLVVGDDDNYDKIMEAVGKEIQLKCI